MRMSSYLTPIAAVLLLAGCSPEQQENTNDAIDNTVESVEPAVEQAQEDLSDAGITGRVKTALIASDNLDSTDIDVDTENKVVFLRGTVPEAAQQSLAESIAKNTVGNDIPVRNKLKVKAEAEAETETNAAPQ